MFDFLFPAGCGAGNRSVHAGGCAQPPSQQPLTSSACLTSPCSCACPAQLVLVRSVAIRRWLAQRPEAAAQLFGAQRLPSLLQYDPYSRLLERHPEDGAREGGGGLPGCLWQPVGLCTSVLPLRSPLPPPACPLCSLPGRHAGGLCHWHSQHRRPAAALLHWRCRRHYCLCRWGNLDSFDGFSLPTAKVALWIASQRGMQGCRAG